MKTCSMEGVCLIAVTNFMFSNQSRFAFELSFPILSTTLNCLWQSLISVFILRARLLKSFSIDGFFLCGDGGCQQKFDTLMVTSMHPLIPHIRILKNLKEFSAHIYIDLDSRWLNGLRVVNKSFYGLIQMGQ